MLSQKLDTKDRKILAELDTDARQSNSDIGKKVGLSKEVVRYRIDRMTGNGTIIRFHSVINYFRIGITKHKLYLRLKNADKRKLDEIGRYFKNHKKTEWVVLTSGRWDMIVGFLVRNVNEFDDEIQEALNLFTDCIQDKAVTTTLYLAHQTRGFLKPGGHGEVSGVVYHTINDAQERIDQLDDEILKLLANNARMPVTDIAAFVKSTPRVVQYRIREMERKKIILAYRTQLNPKAMGNIFCKAIIYLTHMNSERMGSLIAYSSALRGAVWPQRVLGAWDFEIDLELPDYERFQDMLLELKEKFPDIIKDQEFVITSKEFKLDLYPSCYPSNVRGNQAKS